MGSCTLESSRNGCCQLLPVAATYMSLMSREASEHSCHLEQDAEPSHPILTEGQEPRTTRRKHDPGAEPQGGQVGGRWMELQND